MLHGYNSEYTKGSNHAIMSMSMISYKGITVHTVKCVCGSGSMVSNDQSSKDKSFVPLFQSGQTSDWYYSCSPCV